jgi:hypothetical protein
MRNIFYNCKCGNRFDILFRDNNDVTNTARCKCGDNAEREYGFPGYIPPYDPHCNEAQRDIDHFDKNNNKRLYREDQIKQSVNHLPNLKEV